MGVSQPKNVQVSGGNIGFPGDPFYRDFDGATIPGTAQVVITFTVGALKKLNLQQFMLTCRMPVEYKITADAVVIGGGATGAGASKDFSSWIPGRPILAGTVVTITVSPKADFPVATLRAWLQGNQEDLTP